MEHHENHRKAAGSSDLRRQYHGQPVSASPTQDTYSRPLNSPYNNDDDEFKASASKRSEYPNALTSPPSSLPQAPPRRMSTQPSTSQRPSKVSHHEPCTAPEAAQIQDTSSTSSSDWDFLEGRDSTPKSPSSPPKSYEFPGTWPTALYDTTAALSSVGSATSSYAAALTRSGIGKAGWSIGSALASSANKNAHTVLDWAADRTGTGADSLPRPVARWLKSGRERKREVARARDRRGGRDVVFGDREGRFVLETSLISGDGQRVGDEWEDARVEGGYKRFGEGDEEEEELPDGLVRLFEFDD